MSKGDGLRNKEISRGLCRDNTVEKLRDQENKFLHGQGQKSPEGKGKFKGATQGV